MSLATCIIIISWKLQGRRDKKPKKLPKNYPKIAKKNNLPEGE